LNNSGDNNWNKTSSSSGKISLEQVYSSVVNHGQQQQPPPLFYNHYTGQPMSAGTSSYELEDFGGAKFYCPHALAGGSAVQKPHTNPSISNSPRYTSVNSNCNGK